MLLSAGANKDITDKEDRLPRDVAELNCYHRVVQLLDASPSPSSHPDSPNNSGYGINAGTLPNQKGNGKPKPPRRTKSLREPKLNCNSSQKQKTSGGRPKHPSSSEKDSSSSGQSPANSLESPTTFLGTPSPGSSMYQGQLIGAGGMSDYANLGLVSPYSSGQSSTYSPPMYGTGFSPTGAYKTPPPNLNGCTVPFDQLCHASPDDFGQSPPQFYDVQPPGWEMSSPANFVPKKNGMGKLGHPILPTSPTHLAAMKQAAQKRRAHSHDQQMAPLQQRNGSTGGYYDYADGPFLPEGTTALYLPEHFLHGNVSDHNFMLENHLNGCHLDTSPYRGYLVPSDVFPTPSPESPGQWSNGSPHSVGSPGDLDLRVNNKPVV